MNECKTLIWIDDRDDDMEQVARGAFIELWKEGIFNRTVFLGNFFKEVSLEDCRIYGNTVKALFSKLCYDFEVLIAHEIPENKKLEKLYQKCSASSDITEISSCIYDIKNADVKKNIDSTLRAWEELSSADELQVKTSNDTKSAFNIEQFFQTIENAEQFSYALDIVLLKGDEKKLNCDLENGLPILSMEIYHYITEVLKCKCILYSRYTYLNRLASNWKQIYSKLYGGNIFDLDIMSRDCLYEGSIDKNVIKRIIKMYEEDVN